jgi:two-component system response regulator PilR (NtrC family)
VLLVDDEPDLLDLLELDMARMGLDSARAGNVEDALAQLRQGVFDLCLTDMRLPDGEGLSIVRHIAEHLPNMPVAVITAYGSAESAVAALKAGAFDYVEKPVTPEKVRGLVRSAIKVPEPAGPAVGDRPLVGDSVVMRQVRALIDKVARSQAPVFITGETGTGKEVAARLIHAQGSRADAPFVAVNCGAIPENLMESEFFGYRKGAFTGADSDRDGFFQAARGGTLFLDEVTELPLAMQVKLLRAIQEKRVRRVGGTAEEPVDTRIISASHRDLQTAVSEDRFRHDLYYRLNVIALRMPSLRERREDLPELTAHILARLGTVNRRSTPAIDAAALEALRRYDFPGNVRELENILERALALSEHSSISAGDLDLVPPYDGEDHAPGDGGHPEGGLQAYLDATERKAILDALAKTGRNKTAAARLLGVTFRSLRYRLERLGME